jgi:hypothetical protein
MPARSLLANEQNAILADRDAALRGLRHEQLVSERRIEALERDLRLAQEAADGAADTASRDATFHQALADFKLQPRGQSKAAVTAWLHSRGIHRPVNQRRAIEALLQARGHAR